ncbi:hypothetical protein HYU11_06010 [Candidatus Woesearchaeota archaeon]|nr:hypothetical protein [Candidatus Woesearchaeota archaeon]
MVEFYRLYVQAEKDLSVIRGELEALEEQFSRHGHVYDLSRYIGKEILVIGAEGNSSLREKLSSALADVGSLRFLDGESRSVSRLDKFSGVDYVVLILKGTKTHKITQRLGGLPVICSYGTNIFSVLSAMENYGRQAVISNH